MSKVGFIGVGIMGRPMAGHLLKGGHALSVYDIGPIPAELTTAGAVACKSSKEVAEKSMRLYTEKVVPRFDDIRVRAENDPYTGRGEPQPSTDGKAAPHAPHKEKEPVTAGTGRVENDVQVDERPTSVGYGGGAIWSANSQSGTGSRIDPVSHTVRQTVSVGSDPEGIN